MDRSDLRLEMRLKNNLLYRAIFDRYASVEEFACAAKEAGFSSVSGGTVGQLLCFRASPKTKGRRDGNPEYRKPAQQIADFLKMAAEDLFPDDLYAQISNDKAVIETSSKLMLASSDGVLRGLPAPDDSPQEVAQQQELHERLKAVLHTLTYRERAVVELHYGIVSNENKLGETFTFAELAEIFKVSTERIHQIEAKAIRRLQNPERARPLEKFLQAKPACARCNDSGEVTLKCFEVGCPGYLSSTGPHQEHIGRCHDCPKRHRTSADGI